MGKKGNQVWALADDPPPVVAQGASVLRMAHEASQAGHSSASQRAAKLMQTVSPHEARRAPGAIADKIDPAIDQGQARL